MCVKERREREEKEIVKYRVNDRKSNINKGREQVRERKRKKREGNIKNIDRRNRECNKQIGNNKREMEKEIKRGSELKR